MATLGTGRGGAELVCKPRTLYMAFLAEVVMKTVRTDMFCPHVIRQIKYFSIVLELIRRKIFHTTPDLRGCLFSVDLAS